MKTLLLFILLSTTITQVFAQQNSSWEDFYTGNIMGISTSLAGEVKGNTWLAKVNAEGYVFDLEGTIEGGTCLGTMYDPQNGQQTPFLALIVEDQLVIAIDDINPETGQQQLMEFAFTKTDPATYSQTVTSSINSAPDIKIEAGPRDQRLVGNWRFTDSYISGQFSFATDYHMQINADGSFLYGKGRTMGGGPDSSIDSGESAYEKGSWKTENGAIWVHDGSTWQYYAKYYQEGNSLMLTYQNGNKQVWERL